MSDRRQIVVAMREDGRSWTAIGEALGISRQRAEQIGTGRRGHCIRSMSEKHEEQPLSGWRLEWLGTHLERWRAEIDALDRGNVKPKGWIQAERARIYEYETLYLNARYPSTGETE